MIEKKLEQKQKFQHSPQSVRKLEQLKKKEEQFLKENPVWAYKVKCG